MYNTFKNQESNQLNNIHGSNSSNSAQERIKENIENAKKLMGFS